MLMYKEDNHVEPFKALGPWYIDCADDMYIYVSSFNTEFWISELDIVDVFCSTEEW